MAEDLLLPSKNSGKPVLDEANGVVRLVREQPPTHCLLKVDSFSQLHSRSQKDHFETTEFTAGAHTWVMHVYPNGNEKELGNGRLSLYVAMVDKLSSDVSVNVALRFFIYDQIRDNYLTVLDLKEKRFTAVKRVWGIPKLLPISSFNDASNGFLVNDCCVLGAEVLVVNIQIKTFNVSIVKRKCGSKYTWKVEKFSELKDDVLYSPVFTVGGWSWKLKLYLKGNSGEKRKSLSLYLLLDNHHDLTFGIKVHARFGLFLKNQLKGGDHHQKSTQHWFTQSEEGFGFTTFIQLTDLRKQSNGYLVDDTIVVEVDIEENSIKKK